jgi:broad specificity phosphatase PhoE/CTP:molybdopterin cytidylyltransferase MocA
MTHGGQIIALIPAAGFSSRMEDFKPLLPLGRSTIIEEAVDRFRRAGVDDVRVVIGHRAEEMASVLDRLGVRKIVNSDYAGGMLSSVLAGTRSFEPEIEAFFLLPADTPLVKPSTITALANAYRSRGAGIVYPRFEGFRGHPPLISKHIVEDMPGEVEGGLRAFLGRYEAQAVDLDVIDQFILVGCNTVEDYRKLQAYGFRQAIPTERECKALFKSQGATEKMISHCRMVAELAKIFAINLNRAGLALNVELASVSGLLHDLAKGQPDHARAGARILEELGFGPAARIVGLHTDLGTKLQSMDEAELVYLADKLVDGDLLVSLEERFDGPLRKFAARPDILKGVQRRLKDTKAIKQRLEKISGVTVEELIEKYEKSLRTGSNGQRKIYLVRHCAVTHPGDVKRFIGHIDLPLSEEGLRQAQVLAEKLRHTPIMAIYCSDLRRSVETARTIGKLHGIEPVTTSSFREIALGEWEGLPIDEVSRRYPVEYEARGRDFANFRPPGGESFTDCASRAVPALYEALRQTSGDILIVGHAGMNRILLCHTLGKPMHELFDIPQEYGCLNLIRYGDFTLELEILNETIQME